MLTRIKDFLSFNRSEQRGIVVLLLIIFSLIVINSNVPKITKYQNLNYDIFKAEIDAFMLKQQSISDSIDSARKAKYLSRKKSPYPQKKNYSIPVIEINTADTSELVKLRGIGPVFAGRIIKYREMLGGYCLSKQLLEVYGMDSARLNNIVNHITIDTSSIAKIEINDVEFKQLLRHPYFNYSLVKAIFNHRDKIKRFNSINQLKDIETISPEIFKQIRPYLSVDKE
jgi:competence ComEA-like helix-hairpin-helix protein